MSTVDLAPARPALHPLDRRCQDAGRARAPLPMRLRSRPARCCSEGCALQGLRFLARSGPWVAKPAGCRLAFLRSCHLQGTVVHESVLDLTGLCREWPTFIGLFSHYLCTIE